MTTVIRITLLQELKEILKPWLTILEILLDGRELRQAIHIDFDRYSSMT